MKSAVNIFVLAFSVLALLSACDSYEREEVTHEIFVNKHELTLTVGQTDTLIVSPIGTSPVDERVGRNSHRR